MTRQTLPRAVRQPRNTHCGTNQRPANSSQTDSQTDTNLFALPQNPLNFKCKPAGPSHTCSCVLARSPHLETVSRNIIQGGSCCPPVVLDASVPVQPQGQERQRRRTTQNKTKQKKVLQPFWRRNNLQQLSTDPKLRQVAKSVFSSPPRLNAG